MTSICAITPSKNIETYLNEYVLRLMYAACEDVEEELDAKGKYSPYVHHSYASICVDKKERIKLDARFTISDEARQILAFMFNKCIEEVLSISIDTKDTVDQVIEKIAETTNDSFFQFALEFTARQPIGKVLASAHDPGCGLRGFVVSKMPTYISRDSVISMVFTSIDRFLKATAATIIKLWWYQHKPVDGGTIAGLYYACGLNQYMIVEVFGCLREKPAAKPRTKKTKDEVKDDTKTSPEVIPEANTDTVSDQVVDDPLVDLSELDAVLGSVI